MTKNVFFVSPDTPISEVARILTEKSIHGLPVISGGEPVGMITEGDLFTKGMNTVYLPEYVDSLKRGKLIKKISPVQKNNIKFFLEISAEDIMSTPCHVIRQDADIMELLTLMREKNLASVPVVNEQKKISGIVTLFDIINMANLRV